MKSSRAAVHRKTHALPELRFEEQQLTSFSGMVLIRNYSGRHHLDATNKMILYPLPHKSIEKKFFLLDSD